jgi:hypothetical protein
MVERQQVEFNGIQYSPITFEEFAGHTKYSLFGVPRYRFAGKPVAILGTFSTRNLTFTRKDFARVDRYLGSYAYLKPPSGGEAGPSMSIGPAFDDAGWSKCRTLWDVYKAKNGGAEIPRLYFLGTIIFERKVFRSHYLELDTILFADSHAGDPVLPDPLSISTPKEAGGSTHAAPRVTRPEQEAPSPAANSTGQQVGLDPGV